MPNSGPYLLDTCVLVNIRDVHGDSDAIWEALEREIEDGAARTVRHVMDELQKRFPDIYARLKPIKRKFIVSNETLYSEEVSAEIAEIRQQHPKLYDAEGAGNPADPFLIGCAKAMDGIVVTDERTSGKKHKEKIPHVCRSRNVGCANREDFLRAIGVIQ